MGDELGTREEETGPVAASASVWIADRLVRPFCLPSPLYPFWIAKIREIKHILAHYLVV